MLVVGPRQVLGILSAGDTFLVPGGQGDDPATVTPERAYELLAEKRAKGPVKKRTTRKKTAKTTKTTRTSAKTAKSSAKKTTAAAEKSAKATSGRPKAAGRATTAAAEKPS